MGENCVPIPADHIDLNDCPQLGNGSTNFCGVPFPAGKYQVLIHGAGVHSNDVQLTVTTSNPTPVSIVLLYPNYLVSPGDTVAVRGKGFTPTGNAVKIGDAVVSNVLSPDGTTLTFQAPLPAGTSFIPGLAYYNASVSNAKGESNCITFVYRYSDYANRGLTLEWKKMAKPH